MSGLEPYVFFICLSISLSFALVLCTAIDAVCLKHTKSHSYAVCSFRQWRCFNKMILKWRCIASMQDTQQSLELGTAFSSLMLVQNKRNVLPSHCKRKGATNNRIVQRDTRAIATATATATANECARAERLKSAVQS